MKDGMIQVIKENEFSGSDLAEVENYTDFVEYGIKTIMARKLFNALKASFPNEFAMNNNSNNNNNSNDNSNVTPAAPAAPVAPAAPASQEPRIQVSAVQQRERVSTTTARIDQLLAQSDEILANRDEKELEENEGLEESSSSSSSGSNYKGLFSFGRPKH